MKLIQVVTKTTGEVWKGDFDVNGSCCVPDSLKALVKQKNEQLIQKTLRLIKVLAKISTKLMKSLAKALPKMNNSDIQKKIALIKSRAGNIVSKFREANKLMPASEAEMTKFKDFIKNYQDQLQLFRKHGAGCIQAMNRARANLYCALCSGKASEFVKSSGTTDFKIKINKESCDSVVEACFPIWRFNWWVRTAVKYAIVNINRNKGDQAEDKVKSDIELTDTDIEDLKSTFDKCSFNSETKKVQCDILPTATFKLEDHVKRLCSFAIVVNKQNGALEGDESVGEIDDGEVDKIDESIEPEAKPIEPKLDPVNPPPTVKEVAQRLMQTQATEPNLGAEVDSSTNNFKLMNSESAGVASPADVDLSKAGEGTTFANLPMGLSFGLALTSIIAFF